MRFASIAFAACLALFASATSSWAATETRIALVIGNSAYQRVPRLPNPSNDAGAVADLLKKSGFEVESRHDLSLSEMRRAIRDFSLKAPSADIAVVFYAGHGMEVGGANYLVPTDAILERDADVPDETISLDRIIELLQPVKRLRLVILDACRDNPFSNTMARTVATRSVGRGLAKVEVAGSDTLVAFAARAGSTASDGDEKNSPFTSALLNNLTTPGLDLRIALGRVRDEVLSRTNKRQEPFTYGSLGGETVALVPGDDPRVVARDYEYAAQIGTIKAWDAFLTTHPNGFHADLAREQKGKLDNAEQAHAKAEDQRQRAEEQAKGKADEFRKQLEVQAAKQAEEAKKQLTEQARRELDEERRKLAEKTQREVEDARKQAADAKRQAEEAQKQVEEARRQAAAESLRVAAEQAARAKEQQIALAAPTAPPAAAQPVPASPAAQPAPAMDPADVRRLLQAHLKRVGCDPDSIDGNWTSGSQKALEQFNKNAGTNFDVKLASLDALDAVRTKTGRVCPLICGKGQKVEGDRCVQISCESGLVLGPNGVCHKKPEPVAKTAHESTRASGGGGGGGGGGGKCFTFNGKRFCE